MNAERFMELMNTLPDDMIVKAVHAEYRSRPKLIQLLPAIAAGIVLLIAAAVYPKLRMQMPEVTEPPVMTAVTTAAGTIVSEQTTGTLTESAKVQTTEMQSIYTQTQTGAVIATVYTTAVTEHAKTDAPPIETAVPETTALQEQTGTVQTESFTDASQTAIKTSEITEAMQTVTTVSEPNVKRVPISLKKGQTSNIPYNHSGGSPSPGTDTPGGSNQTRLKTETVVTEKHLKFTMPVACQDAVLLSIEYNGYCIEAKFLYLPYFESQINPKTVYYYVTLPDDFDDMLFSAIGEVSETVDPAVFAEAAANEPDYITILEQEESL